MEKEIWKDVSGFEELYQISNLGRFKIKQKIISKNKRGERIFKEKIITGTTTGKIGNQYKTVSISENDFIKRVKLHRLVALAFIENKENLPFVNHIDHNTFNNKVTNLEWVSAMDNACHSVLKIIKKSKYIGVTYSKKQKNWIARTTIYGKRKHIGVYNNEFDAYLARQKFHLENNIINNYV